MNPLYLNSTKEQILFILQHKFYALDFLEPSQLSYYKCLHWSKEFTLSCLHKTNGTIVRDSLTFLPIWQNCTPASCPDQLTLSFRFPSQRDLVSGYGYVIIRPTKNKKES